jgi:hypothetical protein
MMKMASITASTKTIFFGSIDASRLFYRGEFKQKDIPGATENCPLPITWWI